MDNNQHKGIRSILFDFFLYVYILPFSFFFLFNLVRCYITAARQTKHLLAVHYPIIKGLNLLSVKDEYTVTVLLIFIISDFRNMYMNN